MGKDFAVKQELAVLSDHVRDLMGERDTFGS